MQFGERERERERERRKERGGGEREKREKRERPVKSELSCRVTYHTGGMGGLYML